MMRLHAASLAIALVFAGATACGSDDVPGDAPADMPAATPDAAPVSWTAMGEDSPGAAGSLDVASGSLERGFGPPLRLSGSAADGPPDATLDGRGTPVVVWRSNGRAVVQSGFAEDADVQILDEVGTAGPVVDGAGTPTEAPFPAGTGEATYLAIDGSRGPLDLILTTQDTDTGVLWHRRLAQEVDRPPPAASPPGAVP